MQASTPKTPQVRWAHSAISNSSRQEEEEDDDNDDDDDGIPDSSIPKSSTSLPTTRPFQLPTHQPFVPLSLSNSFISTTPGPPLMGSAGMGTSGLGTSGLTFNTTLGAVGGGEGDIGEGDDELFPAMADDDYSAQLSWQSQSKDNLKVLMESFTPEQYDRFEAYRRHALPKQAVRKVIQQGAGQQVSMPVAQIVAGFAKVFVGEMVERARAAQARRGDTGPLSPDHLREAYRMYQQETGMVGAARRLRGKKLFVR